MIRKRVAITKHRLRHFIKNYLDFRLRRLIINPIFFFFFLHKHKNFVDRYSNTLVINIKHNSFSLVINIKQFYSIKIIQINLARYKIWDVLVFHIDINFNKISFHSIGDQFKKRSKKKKISHYELHARVMVLQKYPKRAIKSEM